MCNILRGEVALAVQNERNVKVQNTGTGVAVIDSPNQIVKMRNINGYLDVRECKENQIQYQRQARPPLNSFLHLMENNSPQRVSPKLYSRHPLSTLFCCVGTTLSRRLGANLFDRTRRVVSDGQASAILAQHATLDSEE